MSTNITNYISQSSQMKQTQLDRLMQQQKEAAMTVDPDSKSLKSEDFLKILVHQLKNQNPLEPMSSADMMGQVNSITSARLAQSLDLFTKQQNNNLGQSFLGKQVVVQTLDERGEAHMVQGTVSAVRNIGKGTCSICIDGKDYKATDVVAIAQPESFVHENFADYLGKNVEVKQIDPATRKEVTAQGLVESITHPYDENCRLVVQGKTYDPRAVTQINLPKN